MAATNDNGLLVKFRSSDTAAGVTRATAKRIAEQLGFSETQAVHFALARLAKEVLPAYEQDDGPLSKKDAEAIRKAAAVDRPFVPTSSLF